MTSRQRAVTRRLGTSRAGKPRVARRDGLRTRDGRPCPNIEGALVKGSPRGRAADVNLAGNYKTGWFWNPRGIFEKKLTA